MCNRLFCFVLEQNTFFDLLRVKIQPFEGRAHKKYELVAKRVLCICLIVQNDDTWLFSVDKSLYEVLRLVSAEPRGPRGWPFFFL